MTSDAPAARRAWSGCCWRVVALVRCLNFWGEATHPRRAAAHAARRRQVARGAYLARAGNCMPCHTDRGGAAYAGGRAIETPFGTVYASNLTPDADNRHRPLVGRAFLARAA